MLASLILAQFKPFEDSYQGRVELMNEMMMTLIGASAMTLLGQTSNKEEQEIAGNIIIFFLLLKIGINVLLVLVQALIETKQKCKRRCARKNAMKKAKMAKVPQEE